jgi:hypothetical protein
VWDSADDPKLAAEEQWSVHRANGANDETTSDQTVNVIVFEREKEDARKVQARKERFKEEFRAMQAGRIPTTPLTDADLGLLVMLNDQTGQLNTQRAERCKHHQTEMFLQKLLRNKRAAEKLAVWFFSFWTRFMVLFGQIYGSFWTQIYPRGCNWFHACSLTMNSAARC